jgi:hypothetical protein
VADRPEISALSSALARLGAVAELLSIAAGELFALAAMCNAGLGRRAEISVDGAFERLSLRAGLPAEPERSQLVAELRRRDRMFGDRLGTWLARGDDSALELAQGDGGLTLGLRTAGARPIGDDLARLREISHAGFAVDRLGELLDGRELCAAVVDRYRAPAHHSWELAVELGDGDDVGALVELARAVEIRAAQQALIADLHPILAGSGATLGLRIGPGVVYPELAIAYRDVDPEAAIRLLVGLEIHRDPGEPLGRFLGALGTPERIATVELVVGQHPPPRLRIGD